MMRLLLIGGPASGKGTQAMRLMKLFNIPQISSGDLLRTAIAAKNPTSMQVKKIMDSGQLVPDTIIADLVKERLKKPDCAKGFLLDGFPRTLEQIKLLNEVPKQQALQKFPAPSFFKAKKPEQFALDHVIELAVEDAEAIKRVDGREVHLPSGRVYHKLYNPPKVKGIDDITGEALYTRPDDNPKTMTNRLGIYHRATQPVIDFFKSCAQTKPNEAPKFHHIDGSQNADSVFQNILRALKPTAQPKPS